MTCPISHTGGETEMRDIGKDMICSRDVPIMRPFVIFQVILNGKEAMAV